MLLRIALLALLTIVAVMIAMVSFDRPSLFSSLRISSAAAEEERYLPLRDNVHVRFLNAVEATPNDGGEVTLIATFALKDQAVLEQHEKLISSADQLFGRFVLVPAEVAKRKRAGIFFLISERKEGDKTTQVFEDFFYARQENGVWLREKGTEDWKIAQDPNWVHPESEKVELPGVGTVEVDFAGSMFGPASATKSFGVEMRSATPVKNVNGKYAEMRALWYALNRDKLKAEGYDYVEIQNFTEKKAGFFQVREYVFLKVTRAAGADWPDVPITPNRDPNAPLTASLEPGRAAVAVGKAAAQSSEGTMVRVSLPPGAAVTAPASGVGLIEQSVARVPLRAQLW